MTVQATAAVARCCGTRFPDLAGEPIGRGCIQCPCSPTYWRTHRSKLRDRDGDIWTQTGVGIAGEPLYAPTVDGRFYDQYRTPRSAIEPEFGPLVEVDE